jgi:hypothetical protein
MADDRDEQQTHNFHWPPTSEELESIQVIEVHDEAPVRAATPIVAWRAWWHRMVQEAVIAQVGLAAASIAAIGIAVTSLLAPAQPAARAAKNDSVPAPVIASATVPVATAPAPAMPSTFQHRVTFDTPPPAVEQVREEREARVTTPRVNAIPVAAPTPVRKVTPRPQPSEKRVAKAGKDPVSRFAVHTGLSVWKAMRAVGRSFKRDADEGWSARPATRAGAGRRTAAAVNLAADDAPSAR